MDGHKDAITDISITSDGQQVISASEDGSLRSWDTENKKQLYKIQNHWRDDTFDKIIIDNDRNRFVAVMKKEELQVRNLNNGEVLFEFEKDWYRITSIAIVPSKMWLIAACKDLHRIPILGNRVRIWDLESKKLLYKFSIDTDYDDTSMTAPSITITPDNKRILTASDDTTLRLWDIKSGKLLSTYGGHTNIVSSVVIHPNGKNIISSSFDTTLRLWELDSGGLWNKKIQNCLFVFTGHTSSVNKVIITPNGKYIISVSEDATLRIWDFQSKKCLAVLASETPFSTITAVNNNFFIAGDRQGTLHFIEAHIK